MKTVLVTGGCGFLGSNLCRRLIREKNRVICVDNTYTGRMENIADLMNNQKTNFQRTFFLHHSKNEYLSGLHYLYNSPFADV